MPSLVRKRTRIGGLDLGLGRGGRDLGPRLVLRGGPRGPVKVAQEP